MLENEGTPPPQEEPMSRVSMIVRPLALAAAAAAVAIMFAGCEIKGGDAGEPSVWVTEGKITIGTGQPAYFPWVIDDAPESGEGFEAAVAYAVAGELGFEPGEVVWIRTTFDEAIAPGAKYFDVNLQQFSITPERQENVDFSSSYYQTTQVVMTTAVSTAAGATTIEELKGLLIGAQTGTTSFQAVEQIIAPTAGAQGFSTNEDAKLALESGTVDAIVVDLRTAFYLAEVELTDGRIIGQLPESSSGDKFGLVLAKDSPLTVRVSNAVDELRRSGVLDDIAAEWLADAADAPVLEPPAVP
jgi:polar amino acid transport system substrate-binding protein